MSKKPKYQKRLFESTGAKSDISANIYLSMLTSEAWFDLSRAQQVLYLACKSRYYGEKKKPVEGDSETFTFARYQWKEVYKLYTDYNKRGFYRDMQALLDHGFIELVSSGRATREKNIYKFSSMWRHFGTANFSIPANQKVTVSKKA